MHLHLLSVGIAIYNTEIDVDGLSGFFGANVVSSGLTSEMTGRQPWCPTNPQTQSS